VTHSPRILDASALIALFNGHPDLLRLLRDAGDGGAFLLLPTVAVAEAESALHAGASLWTPFLMFHGVSSLDLTVHTAIEAAAVAALETPGAIAGPLMAGQVVYEARALNAVVVTQVPQFYDGFDVALMVVEE
jgi:hypothetical protein